MMMRATSTLLLIVGVLGIASAFVPNRFLDAVQAGFEFTSFTSVNHRDITEDAVLRFTQTLLAENPNPAVPGSTDAVKAVTPPSVDKLLEAYFGSSSRDRARLFKDAIDEIQDSNEDTDLGQEEMLAAAHFDGEQIIPAQERLVFLRGLMVGEIGNGSHDEARLLLGRMLHSLQDFYSHSNWIEMGQTTPNSAIGVAGENLGNVAPPDMPTCSDCPVRDKLNFFQKLALKAVFDEIAEYVYDCQGNILESINTAGILTTGYYGGSLDANGDRISKPCGKCGHGGVADWTSDVKAKGGINKDSLSTFFTAHPHLHVQAATMATDATVQFLQSVRTEINDDFSFANLFNIKLQGSPREEVFTSIAYVIDTTASMSDVLPEIQAALPEIMTELNEYLQDLGEGAALKFILVPYNDPDPGSVFVTKKATEFTAAVGDLIATGASDCSEPTFGAIVRALKQSLPRSSVFVFTDAPASDEGRFAEAQALVTKKDIEVNFILTPGCARRRRSRRASGRDLYRFLASFSGGQVLNVAADEVASLSRLVGTSARRTHTSISLPRDGSLSFSGSIPFLVAASVREVVIIANGVSLSTTVTTPAGGNAQSLPEFQVDLQSSSTFIAVINTSSVAQYGEWSLAVTASADYDVRVIGLVDVDFEYRHFRPDATSHFAYSIISSKPIINSKLMLIIEAVGDLDGFTFPRASLKNIESGSLLAISLEAGSGGEFTGKIAPPVGSYRLQVDGASTAAINDIILSCVSSRGIHVTDLELALGEGEFTFVTLFRGGQRSIKLTLRNLGTASEVKLATVGSSGGAAFTVSVSPTTVTVAANAMTEITLTVQAPVSIPESTTASLQLIVTATASDNILRNDYVVFDIFASNIELPVVRSATEVPSCSTGNSGSMGGDPHFSIALHDGNTLCYSVRGRTDSIFNLISCNDFLINAKFVPDSKRKNVTWIGSLGVVFKKALKYGGSRVTYFKFDAQSHTVHVGKEFIIKANTINELISYNGNLSITKHHGSPSPSSRPVVSIHLREVGLNLTVKFEGEHLDMSWQSAVKSWNSHGLVGQFFRKGVEVDEVRKLLFLPNNPPVPVEWRPVWRFMERRVEIQNVQHCWAAMNPGNQGKGLIDGHYLDYLVEDVLTSGFKFESSSKI